jgi:hypothetical protein
MRREAVCYRELPRMTLLRRWVNKGKKKDRGQSRSFQKQASSECDSHRPGPRRMDFGEPEGKGLGHYCGRIVTFHSEKVPFSSSVSPTVPLGGR